MNSKIFCIFVAIVLMVFTSEIYASSINLAVEHRSDTIGMNYFVIYKLNH